MAKLTLYISVCLTPDEMNRECMGVFFRFHVSVSMCDGGGVPVTPPLRAPRYAAETGDVCFCYMNMSGFYNAMGREIATCIPRLNSLAPTATARHARTATCVRSHALEQRFWSFCLRTVERRCSFRYLGLR